MYFLARVSGPSFTSMAVTEHKALPQKVFRPLFSSLSPSWAASSLSDPVSPRTTQRGNALLWHTALCMDLGLLPVVSEKFGRRE